MVEAHGSMDLCVCTWALLNLDLSGAPWCFRQESSASLDHEADLRVQRAVLLARERQPHGPEQRQHHPSASFARHSKLPNAARRGVFAARCKLHFGWLIR